MRSDIVAGGLCLLLAGVFWLELDVTNRYAAIFPQVLLIAMTVTGAAILAIGLVRREPEPVGEETRRRGLLAVALCVLLAWVTSVGLVGFSVSGVVAFLATVWIIRRGRLSAKTVAVDVAVAVVAVVGCALLFLRVFNVPLPVSPFLGV